MKLTSNPLACDTYINLGNYFQDSLSNHSNLVLRTALVFAKIVGRAHDILIHTGLGTLKLTASTSMAVYSIPAAAFGCIPTHHKVAKEASRHFGLAVFFVADIFLSLTNIINKYPQHLVNKIQKFLEIENICEEVDTAFNNTLRDVKEMSTKPAFDKILKLTNQKKRLKEDYDALFKEHDALLKVSAMQEMLITIYKQNQGAENLLQAHQENVHPPIENVGKV